MAGWYNYALGVDLGIASIGTALVRLNEDGEPCGLLDAGVRIFSVAEGGAARRQARQSRKTLRRRRQRLRALTSRLQQAGLLPEEPEALARLLRRSPYALRARAARFRLPSSYALGRCLLHLARFRGAGFLNQLEDGGENDGAKKDRQKSANAYRLLEQRLRESGQTLGEYLWQRQGAAEHHGRVRRRQGFVEDGSVDYAVPRFLVRQELRRIWECQRAFYPQLLTEELRQEVTELIFRDRPHAPYAVGLCSLDPDSGERRLPRMHRLAELRRIYEQINNIRFRTATAVHALTRPMRDALAERCLNGERLNRSEIKKILGTFCDEKIVAVNLAEETTNIAPFALVAAFADIPHWREMSEAEQDALLDFIAEPRLEPEKGEASPLMPEDVFLRECARRLRLSGDDAGERVSRCCNALPQDRSMLGETATRRILQLLRDGPGDAGEWRPLSFREAADLCGYTAEEEAARALGGTLERLPYYGEVLRHDVSPVHPWHVRQADEEEARYGRIPNPVVHVALNQLRKVVNEIIALYGRPRRICVELAREFGLSAEKRKALEMERLNGEKENRRIDGELEKLGLPSSRRNRIKYRLWEEQKGVDIYTLEPIAATGIAGCEIDHIIPRSLGGSDTYANLALIGASANLGKRDVAAYDFIQTRAPEQWPHILERISAPGYPRNKAWRFLPDVCRKFEAEGDADQTDSRMTDTGYMAKMAARYLRAVCAEVTPLRGGMTARLRHLWGLDGLEYPLLGLPVRREIYDPATGEVVMDERTGYPKRNPAWKAKARVDHRHHALDALVLACATRGMMQHMARADRLGLRCDDIPVPFGIEAGAFRDRVAALLRGVRVSPKAEHGKEGALHEATRYRVLAPVPRSKGMYTAAYRRSLSKLESRKDVAALELDEAAFSGIAGMEALVRHNRALREAIEAEYKGAARALDQRREEARREGRKERAITEKAIVQEAVLRARRHNPALGAASFSVKNKTLVGINARLQCGYTSDSNYCMDFFVNKGKVGWECISRFDVNQPGFVPEWQRKGCSLIWRLCKGDVLEMRLTEKLAVNLPEGLRQAESLLFVVQQLTAGKLMVRLLNDARPMPDKKVEDPCWLSGEKGLDFYLQAQARKVDLTPFGKVWRKHRKLWHGTQKKTA